MATSFVNKGTLKSCKYFDEEFNIVHTYDASYVGLHCGNFGNPAEGLAKIWDKAKTHCIDMNGRVVTDVKECTSW